MFKNKDFIKDLQIVIKSTNALIEAHLPSDKAPCMVGSDTYKKFFTGLSNCCGDLKNACQKQISLRSKPSKAKEKSESKPYLEDIKNIAEQAQKTFATAIGMVRFETTMQNIIDSISQACDATFKSSHALLKSHDVIKQLEEINALFVRIKERFIKYNEAYDKLKEKLKEERKQCLEILNEFIHKCTGNNKFNLNALQKIRSSDQYKKNFKLKFNQDVVILYDNYLKNVSKSCTLEDLENNLKSSKIHENLKEDLNKAYEMFLQEIKDEIILSLKDFKMSCNLENLPIFDEVINLIDKKGVLSQEVEDHIKDLKGTLKKIKNSKFESKKSQELLNSSKNLKDLKSKLQEE